MKKICVLGSNSGRNAGDAAILSSIVLNILDLKPDTLFEVPVPRKRDLTSRFDPAVVRPVPMMPWNFSLRFVGLTTFTSILRSDVVLITDGIIFDVKLFNPIFNFLILLIFVVPFAKLFNKKVIGLLVGIGPLHSKPGRIFTRFVGNLCDDIFVREHDSEKLLLDAGVKPEKITVYADAAFVDKPVRGEKIDEILNAAGIAGDETVIGLNVNSYLDQWLESSGKGITEDTFAAELAEAVDLITEEQNAKVAFVLTQVMDVNFAEKVLRHVKNPERTAVFSNREQSPEELMGLMERMKFFIGMRLHSLILATAVDTPVIGLAYAPKVRHFMTLLDMEQYKIELTEMTARSLADAVADMRSNEKSIQNHVDGKAALLRGKALDGYKAFAQKYL